jgi:hypothetical protein
VVRLLLVSAILFGLSACGQAVAEETEETSELSVRGSGASSDEAEAASGETTFAGHTPYSLGSDEADDEEEEREPFDEYAAKRKAERDVASDSYMGIGSPYGCTSDCSGHEAGFAHRRDNGYVAYSADSQSFTEGAQAYEDEVEERVDEMRSSYESGEEQY